MSSEFLQTLSQGVIALGVLLSALGGFGAYYFGKKVESENRQVQEQKISDQEAKKATVGHLREENPEKILDISEKKFPEFEFGDSGAIFKFTGPQGSPLFTFADDNHLIVSIENGQVLVSTVIKDKKGGIVAEIVNNDWKINPQNSWDRNYSSNALEVKDPSGDIVLQVRLFEGRVQFQGKLYDSTGRGIAFGKVLGPDGWGGGMEITGPKHPELEMKIKPIFKYPSELHLGELINKN